MSQLGVKDNCSAELTEQTGFAASNLVASNISAWTTHVSLLRSTIIENKLANDSVFIVSSGIMGLQHVLSDGRRSISLLYRSGDVIDLRHCKKTTGSSLVALSTANICQLAGTDYDAMINDSPKKRNLFLSNSRNQLDRVTRHCVDLGKKSAAEKFSSFLLECRNRQKIDNDRNPIDLMLNRIDIADYLGLRQETLSRVVAKLERSGLIGISDDNQFGILDMTKLRQIADGAKMA